MKVAVIGHGEAGSVLAAAMAGAGAWVAAFDLLAERRTCASVEAAVEGAALVLSTVPAAQARRAAEAAVPLDGLFVDLNSVPPDEKRAICALTGGVAGVAMDTVPACGAAVPLLLSGARASDAAVRLRAVGLNARAVGADPGRCAEIKLTRSIVVKGLEAVLCEAGAVGDRLGVTAEVLASLARTYPGFDWPALMAYHIDRVRRHGERRADEIEGAAAMAAAAGLDPTLSRAIAAKHRQVARAPPGKKT